MYMYLFNTCSYVAILYTEIFHELSKLYVVMKLLLIYHNGIYIIYACISGDSRLNIQGRPMI